MVDKYLDKWRISREMDEAFEWSKWKDEIPYLKFPGHWKVKIMPPFAGAIIRFSVTTNDKNHVSVYLDCYAQLGSWDEPYWEIYPYEKIGNQNSDVYRGPMNKTVNLLEAIELSLKNQDINSEFQRKR